MSSGTGSWRKAQRSSTSPPNRPSRQHNRRWTKATDGLFIICAEPLLFRMRAVHERPEFGIRTSVGALLR
ncbi:hypothetical protein AAFF_G00303870 [Aldrovandia affinis]|uniref:Uncharacterized protein n=1 Tax=Aldrovandia affinis TaxID=143900 RepID=A0AAD7SP73_9TELE|nr:hypothetical protein AAFF_G00303870 [Aldrovandia affinis]